jgi:iron complex outermembrane receptor protein
LSRLALSLIVMSALIMFTVPAAAQDEPPDETTQPEASEETEAEPPAPEPPTAEPPAAEPPAPEPPAAEGAPVEGEVTVGLGGAKAEAGGPAAAPKEEEEVEEIVVTGTRIGRSNLESYAHIAVVSSEDIKMSGASTINEILDKLPSITLGGINRQINNGGNGYAALDLRNMGPGRVLILINGRRMVGGGFVDVNNVPVEMIERVEILLDGASAVYGSDAVAGVINFILRKDFQGFRADVSGGITDKGDGEEIGVSTTMGGNFDKGNIVFNFGYMKRMEIKQWDRKWATNPTLYEAWDTDPVTGELLYGPDGEKIYVSEHGSYAVPGGLWYGDAHSYVVFLEDPGNEDEYFEALDPTKHLYDFTREQYLSGRMERFTITSSGTYALSENVEAFMESTYTHRNSRNRMAACPIGFGTNNFPGQIQMPITNPYIPEEFLNNLTLMGDDTLYFYRRMKEVGNRIFNNYMHTFRMVTGLTGDITENYSWEIYLNYGKQQNLDYDQNTVNLARVHESTDPDLCAMNANKGCIVGDYFGPNDLQPEVADYIRLNAKGYSEWNMIDTGLALRGMLFDLPGGTVGAVLGFQARWESGGNFPDSTVEAGDGGDNAQSSTQGDYSAQEVFGEVSLPILKEIPAIYSWTIDLAGRFSRYESFGSEFTYRAGTSWAPIADFTLRGVYSTAFRAPSIWDLYGGAQDSHPDVSDPCNNWDTADVGENVAANCEADGVPEGYLQKGSQIRALYGSNPDLDPEIARHWNVGLIFTPTFMPKALNLTATFDFYDLTIEDAIGGLGPQYILDKCYQSDPAEFADNEYCKLIERRPNGQIHVVKAISMNLMEAHTNGFDWTVSLDFPIYKEVLKGNVGWQNNWLLTYEAYLQDEDETAEEDLPPDYFGPANAAGTIDYDYGTLANWRWLANFDFGGNWWTISNRVRFIQGAKIYGTDYTYPTLSVPNVAYWDISGGLTWKGLDFIVGINNVLDKEPPFTPSGVAGANANLATYDAVGRYIYARIGYQFL